VKKYSPVFGRYGFLVEGQGQEIRLGMDVNVTKKNEERSGFGTSIYFIKKKNSKSILTGKFTDWPL
jgi:hypothetical protein